MHAIPGFTATSRYAVSERPSLRPEREQIFDLFLFLFPFNFGGGSVLRNTDCASMKAEVVFIVGCFGLTSRSSGLPFREKDVVFSPVH